VLVDSRTLSANEDVATEVCIVGSGPAGLTLGRELAGQEFRACILESGGLEYDEAVQSLAASSAERPTYGTRN
jgi:flavin-dependent dehydrogenase